VRIDSTAPRTTLAALLVAGFAAGGALQAQQPTGAAGALAVGTTAPDFTLPGATRYGLLEAPVRLSDFRGKTVVLAFFFKARTKG
jgi:peroxiredoxin Q/BCP